MTTYNTGNAVPSTAPKDLYDNAQAMDEAVNSAAPTFTDRLGRARTTLWRAIELGMASADVYPDVPAALAATTDGDYFSVPAWEEESYLVLFRNEGGMAAEKKRLPSSARVGAVEGRATALEARATTAESNIASLDGRLDAVEPAVAELDGRLDVAEGDIDTLQLQVAELQYVPPAIDALLIDGATSKTVETGSSVSSAALSWTLSGDIPESQSIDQGVGSVPVGTTSKVAAGPFTASRTWTLTVGATSPAGNPAQDTAAVSLNFRLKRYWGVSANPTLSSAEILALSGEFSTSRGKSVAYDATGSRYPYYCYPASWGALVGVTVGGLAFSDYTETIQSFTNASGHTEDYRVIRFNSLQNGANIPVVWS